MIFPNCLILLFTKLSLFLLIHASCPLAQIILNYVGDDRAYQQGFLVGPKFFKVYQSLVTTSHFLPNLFLPCKNTFMDDYDGI